MCNPFLQATTRSLRLSACAAALITAGVLAGCNGQDSQQVKQDAQQQTQQARQEAQQAGQDVKAAVKQGADDVVAAAQGIKAGINSNTGNPEPAPAVTNGMTADGRIDLNSASTAQLERLPGIHPAQANAITSARPFSAPQDVVTKGALSQMQFNRISARVVAM